MTVQRRSGFFLLALTIAYVALLIVGGSNVRIAVRVPHDAAIAGPFVAQHSWAIRWGSFCEFVSANSAGDLYAILDG